MIPKKTYEDLKIFFFSFLKLLWLCKVQTTQRRMILRNHLKGPSQCCHCKQMEFETDCEIKKNTEIVCIYNRKLKKILFAYFLKQVYNLGQPVLSEYSKQSGRRQWDYNSERLFTSVWYPLMNVIYNTCSSNTNHCSKSSLVHSNKETISFPLS